MKMDLNRIERLTRAIRRIKEAKFTSNGYSVSMTELRYLTEETAREIRNALNDAIGDILKKFTTELRKELAACAKD